MQLIYIRLCVSVDSSCFGIYRHVYNCIVFAILCINFVFSSAGNPPSTWHFYEKMREVYGHRPAANEVDAAMAEMDRENAGG